MWSNERSRSQMIHQPNLGSTVYEVAIYNKDVRALVKENQSHSFYEDHWADEQHQDVAARDELEAREIIEKRFPPSQGFVIIDVHPAKMDARFHV